MRMEEEKKTMSDYGKEKISMVTCETLSFATYPSLSVFRQCNSVCY